jgi:hypothetical protein
MPLGRCDCYGGCWGDHSVDWPSIKLSLALMEEGRLKNPRYPSSAIGNRILREANVPYGCAVVMPDSIRLETPEFLAAVLDVINELKFA